MECVLTCGQVMGPESESQVMKNAEAVEWVLDRRQRRLALIAVLAIVGVHLGFSLLSAWLGPSTGAGNRAALGGTVSSLALVFIFQRVLGLPVAEFGLSRPASWPRTILLGVIVAIASQAVTLGVMTFVINPLIGADPPDVSRFSAVEGNLKVLLTMIPTVWLTSAFPEEVIWRGFLMTRVAKLFGGSRGAWGMALVLTSVHFGLVHFYQGVSGILATGLIGFLYGLTFLLLGRNLWLVIVAHAASHVLGFTAMYFGLVS